MKTAFLNGELEEEIFLELPEEIKDKSRIVKLQRSLYGLKQAPRHWNKRFNKFLARYRFEASPADRCVYRGQVRGSTVLLAVYVDDGLVVSKEQEVINDVLEALKNEFEVTIGTGNYFVGMEIRQDVDIRNITISQTQYIKRMLERFGMSNAKSVSIPADPNVHMKSSVDKDPTMFNVPYRQIVGSLMFVTVVTRPDIMFAVAKMSRHLVNPSTQHWKAVKKIC